MLRFTKFLQLIAPTAFILHSPFTLTPVSGKASRDSEPMLNSQGPLMRNMLLVTTLLCASYLTAQTNVQIQERGGNLPPGENVVGKVTAVSKDSLTLTPMMGGDAVTVKVGESTRVTRERQPAKLEDVKADEVVFARGKLNGNVMDAAVVMVVPPEMMQMAHGGAG